MKRRFNYWKRIEQQSAPHIALVAERMMDAFRRTGQSSRGPDAAALVFRHHALDRFTRSAVLKATAEAQGSCKLRASWRSTRLHRSPSLSGTELNISTVALNWLRQNERANLEVVRNLIHNHTRRIGRYTCGNCGFKARQFHWQCPGCSTWESYPPLRSEELDLQNA